MKIWIFPSVNQVLPNAPKFLASTLNRVSDLSREITSLYTVSNHYVAFQENLRWLSDSFARDRSLLLSSQIADFLDPMVPMDQLFTYERFLGNGYYGQVSLWTTQTGQSIAIKELFDRQIAAPGLHDFEVGLTLDHPNIVQVNHLVNKVDEMGKIRRYLVMEYVEGGHIDLGMLTEAERLSLIEEMLDSTQHMLNRGVLPRDLHFGNIMRTSDGHWKWVDLGLYISNFEEAALRSISSTLSELNRVAIRLAKQCAACDSPIGDALDLATRNFLKQPIAKGMATPQAISALKGHVGNLLAIVRAGQVGEVALVA
jgi:serine/threonine protein kinase